MGTRQDVAELAILGGPGTVTEDPGDLFSWPIVTKEDEEAVLEVLRRGAMSESDVTRLFEKEMAAYFGTEYALAYCNGTASILGAMWACGVRSGTEIIAPALPFWASVMPAYSLQGTVVFADVDPDTICIDPADIEHRITDRTRAVVAVHAYGHPADMDPIMEIARRHDLKVIEDVSHAHGGLYKGRMLGSIGDAGCMSLMSGKSLAIGEGGMLLTDDRSIWEHALAFGFYARAAGGGWAQSQGSPAAAGEVTDPELARFAGVPLGGCKHRLNQTASAMGRVQLRCYPRRMVEIRDAMNFFWDSLRGVPGIRAHRVPTGSGSTMGGWYCPVGIYEAEEIGGLPIERFVEAVQAEGAPCSLAPNFPLHLHPFFREADVYGQGRPTAVGQSGRRPRGPEDLPVAEAVPKRLFRIPWFKHFRPEKITPYAEAIRNVAENARRLLST